MVAVWRHAASFDPARASPSTWIYAIARNRRIDAFRRAGRAIAAADDPLLQLDPAPDGFRLLDVAEREARLRAAIAGLAARAAAGAGRGLLRGPQPRRRSPPARACRSAR